MPADTFSNTLGFLQMATGNDNNTWGTNANGSVFQIFEDAIANVLTSAVTGGTLDLSGTPPPTAPSQVRYAALTFTGTLTSNQIIKVPNLTKLWFVANATSGAFTLSMQTPSGSPVAIPQNAGNQRVLCDGANNIKVAPFNSQQVQMPDGSAALPSYSDVNETNSGLYRHGTQDWRFSVGGVDIFQITGGSGSPASSLNVLQALSVQGAAVSSLPSGIEFPYAGVALPSGFLWEFGQTVSRASFPSLLAALRISFTGTFNNGSSTITGTSIDLRNLGIEGATCECSTPGITGISTNSGTTSTTVILQSNATGNSGGAVTIFLYPFGNGDGSTTFGIPDRRGRVLAGRDNMSTTPGTAPAGRLTFAGSGIFGSGLEQAGGQETVTVAQANLPNVNFNNSGIALNDPTHSHVLQVNGSGSSNSVNVGTPIGQAVGGSGNPQCGNVTLTDLAASTGITVSSQGSAASGGSGTALQNTQPTGITNYIIKT